MQPGRPVAMMLFKSWGYMMAYNGLNYVSDMKIGHYLKGKYNQNPVEVSLMKGAGGVAAEGGSVLLADGILSRNPSTHLQKPIELHKTNSICVQSHPEQCLWHNFSLSHGCRWSKSPRITSYEATLRESARLTRLRV